MAVHILEAFGGFVTWVGSLCVKPFGRCWRCGGRGNIRRGNRAPACPRCHGARRQQRLGSRTVHRAVRMVRAELARTRKENLRRHQAEQQR
jgi:hypothetical protein